MGPRGECAQATNAHAAAKADPQLSCPRFVQRNQTGAAGLVTDWSVKEENQSNRGGFGSGGGTGGSAARFRPLSRKAKGESHIGITGTEIPSKGDWVELHCTGVARAGYVWYADQLQVLVKWEDGRSSSLRLGRDRFHIRDASAHAKPQDEAIERKRSPAKPLAA